MNQSHWILRPFTVGPDKMRLFSNNRDPRDDGQVFMAIIFILAGSSIATMIVSVVAIVCGCVL